MKIRKCNECKKKNIIKEYKITTGNSTLENHLLAEHK